jgi:hypothetical protein
MTRVDTLKAEVSNLQKLLQETVTALNSIVKDLADLLQALRYAEEAKRRVDADLEVLSMMP